MIVLKAVTREHDRHCSSCAAYRKPNYTELTFTQIRLSISEDSNGLVVTMCNECLTELKNKIIVLEETEQ